MLILADEEAKVAVRRVLVVGAGIAGLATALRLHQAGWEPVIAERAPARRSSGYLVNLIGTGYDAARRLGLGPALATRDIGAFTSILVRADGRRKMVVPAELAQSVLGDRALSVFRGDLETALYELVAEHVDIRFNTTVSAITQDSRGVDVVLSDGSTDRFDLLVGADGLHSVVRRMVFGPDSGARVDLPNVVAAFPLERPPADVPEGAGTTFIGPGRTAAVMNLGSHRSVAFFTYRCEAPDREVALGPHAALDAAFGDLRGGVPDALNQLAAELATKPDFAYFDTTSQIVMDRWSTGRIVLVGDAAWCVTLFAGYGAALALTGADSLGTVLETSVIEKASSEKSAGAISAALAEWESGLRPEVRKRQALARRGMTQYAPPTRFHVWLSDLIVRATMLPPVRAAIRRRIDRTRDNSAL